MFRISGSHLLDVARSTLASSVRSWQGTMGRKQSQQPAQLPYLFDRENDAQCRLVREMVTHLNMDIWIVPVPIGGERHVDELRQLSGSDRVPFLHDPVSGAKVSGAGEIINWLAKVRGVDSPRRSALSEPTSRLASILRGRRGSHAQPSLPCAQPLVLYSFESSPFSRLVRERLCELELKYRLVNLSKQQIDDLGPAVQRFHLGEYRPLPGSKREAFLSEHGRVQVPFLVDPNTGESLFESDQILAYLDRTYGLAGREAARHSDQAGSTD